MGCCLTKRVLVSWWDTANNIIYLTHSLMFQWEYSSLKPVWLLARVHPWLLGSSASFLDLAAHFCLLPRPEIAHTLEVACCLLANAFLDVAGPYSQLSNFHNWKFRVSIWWCGLYCICNMENRMLLCCLRWFTHSLVKGSQLMVYIRRTTLEFFPSHQSAICSCCQPNMEVTGTLSSFLCTDYHPVKTPSRTSVSSKKKWGLSCIHSSSSQNAWVH